MRTLTFLLLFYSTFLTANTDPIKTTSKIEQVTVFKNGAQVNRVATTNIPSGKQVLKFHGLPPSFDEKSFQLKAAGDFTVLAVQHQVQIDTQAIDDQLIARLNRSNDSLAAVIEEWTLQLEVLSEEEALILNNNKNKDQSADRLAIDELKSMAAFYRTQLKEIRLEKLRFQRKINATQANINQQQQAVIAQQNKGVTVNHKEVLVTISAKTATTGKFELSYIVNNAGWIPTYDLRVKDVQSPIDVLYKANVFQNSGEDWEEVKLTLSNADPRLSGQKPNLTKWNLGFYTPTYRRPIAKPKSYQPTGISYNADGSRNIRGRVLDFDGETLIGASVFIRGTNTGTTTDIDGNFEITVPAGYANLEISYTGYKTQKIDLTSTYDYNFRLDEDGLLLDEVVVTGYGGGRNKLIRERPKREKKQATQPIAVTTFKKTTSVEFQIKEPYTIKKDGEKYTVTIQQLDIPAYYEYYCAPKLEEAVFLTAMVSDWEDYNLLSGATSLYFEGTFLGNAHLDVESLQDTISLSLGRDKNILVKRSLQKDYSKKQFIGNKKMESKAIEIEIRNKKKQPINLIIEDHLPVAITGDIEVKIGAYKGAKLNKDSKILKWELQIAPENTQKIGFDYSVKYPKRNRVVLD